MVVLPAYWKWRNQRARGIELLFQLSIIGVALLAAVFIVEMILP